MKWSKLKQNLESNFANCLTPHLSMHATKYRHYDNDIGRIWFQWDKYEILCFKDTIGNYPYSSDLWSNDPRFENWAFRKPFDEKRIYNIKHETEEFSYADFYLSAKDYLQNSIEDNQTSDNTILKALSMLDKRVGKRRLNKYKDEIPNDWHPLVKGCFLLRAQTENLIHQPDEGLLPQ